MKVLIIQNKRIGDVLLTSVLAKNIKSTHPDSEIHFFCYDYTTPVIENNPYIDRIISVNADHLKKKRVLLNQCNKIKNEKYDVILDPYAKFQSKLMCYLSQSPVTAGFIRKKKILSFQPYSIKVKYKAKTALACGKTLDDRVNLCDKAIPLNEKFYKPKIYLASTKPSLKKANKPYLIVGVLGSVFSKSLPVDTMASLVDRIAMEYPTFSIVFNYAPHQAKEAREIYKKCKYKDHIDKDAYEPDLTKFLHVLNNCHALISNEGGSVHMAKAMEIPTFTIYSPFIQKESWNSFENLDIHDSIHLKDVKPDLYQNINRKKMKEIEKEPAQYYNELSAKIIWENLQPYLNQVLKK